MRKLVLVEWVDSFSLDNWQRDASALQATVDPMECKTVGYLLAKTKETVVVCHTVNAENQVCGVLQIPRRCIKSLLYLN